ncbi:MAG: DUF1294 domain-containing protein [Bacteroidales bacterium]|nr:DUF1294 domain-containing protein [Bacteroidales bacterium]
MNFSPTIQAIIIYLLAISVVTFFVFGIDKLKAKHNSWRVPERVLLSLAALGGSIGAWLGMSVWHHKTQHDKFKYGVPAILVIQITIVVVVVLYMRGRTSF